MPLYVYECPSRHQTERVFSVADRPLFVECETCGRRGRRIIVAAVVHGFDGEYQDENLANDHETEPYVVKSRGDRRRRMKELGLVEKPMTDNAKDRRYKATVFSMPQANA